MVILQASMRIIAHQQNLNTNGGFTMLMICNVQRMLIYRIVIVLSS